jgi:hypothetical protein
MITTMTMIGTTTATAVMVVMMGPGISAVTVAAADHP